MSDDMQEDDIEMAMDESDDDEDIEEEDDDAYLEDEMNEDDEDEEDDDDDEDIEDEMHPPTAAAIGAAAQPPLTARAPLPPSTVPEVPAPAAPQPPPQPQGERLEEDAAFARRRAIQAIMRDTSLSEQDKRMQIQNLMSGGRTVVACAPAPILPSQQAAQQQQQGGAGAAAAAASANAACVHYERNCNIVAPCCNRIFGCRICHDELSAADHPPMNRFLIREVVCKNCNLRQSATNQCTQCQTVFGEYHCGVCNLWMSMSKKPFHCDLCGFCRVGGVEAFRHCNECCMCISVSVFETHQCFKDKYKNNCPVCREDMFSSRQSPQDLPCGHAIHAHCFRKLAGFDYRCPICKKTVVSQQSMAAAWEARARDIAEHPMPDDLQRIVDIMCNDCETKSPNRQWHFLGIQCPQCNSFNTVVEQVVSVAPPSGPPSQPAPGGGDAAPAP